MQESVTIHKSPTPVRQHSRMNQARLEEEEKRIREAGKTEARRQMEKRQPNKKIYIRGTKTMPT